MVEIAAKLSCREKWLITRKIKLGWKKNPTFNIPELLEHNIQDQALFQLKQVLPKIGVSRLNTTVPKLKLT